MNYFQIDAFRGDANTIRIVGHRGARGILPENSMIGFNFALSIGVDLLEFDVLLTADNVPVITHNRDLYGAAIRGPDGKFLTGAGAKIASLSIKELMGFDIGRLDGHTDYGRRFPEQAQMDGVCIPRLSELLQLVSQPKYQHICLMLELKSSQEYASDVKAREKLVSVVVNELRKAGLAKRTLLHSFDWTLLAECKKQVSDIPTSFLTQLKRPAEEIDEESLRYLTPDLSMPYISVPDEVKKAGGALWCPHFKDITKDDLLRAKDLGLCVAVWTVNEADEIDAMIDLHVDAIVTDYPGRVQRQLAYRGWHWARSQHSAIEEYKDER